MAITSIDTSSARAAQVQGFPQAAQSAPEGYYYAGRNLDSVTLPTAMNGSTPQIEVKGAFYRHGAQLEYDEYWTSTNVIVSIVLPNTDWQIVGNYGILWNNDGGTSWSTDISGSYIEQHIVQEKQTIEIPFTIQHVCDPHLAHDPGIRITPPTSVNDGPNTTG